MTIPRKKPAGLELCVLLVEGSKRPSPSLTPGVGFTWGGEMETFHHADGPETFYLGSRMSAISHAKQKQPIHFETLLNVSGGEKRFFVENHYSIHKPFYKYVLVIFLFSF